jgi:hypothetical protein
MSPWNLLFRRAHLYLGLALVPWMLVYALSTFTFNHSEHFRQYRPANPAWLPLWERDYAIDLPAGGGDALRATAQRILADNGIAGGFGAQRQGPRLTLNVQNFWHPLRLTYDPATKKLRAEQRRFAPLEVLIRLHERAGYGQPGVLNNVWAFVVDLYCVASLIWIGTGLYLWWNLPVTRTWGFVTLGGGIVSFLILLGTL